MPNGYILQSDALKAILSVSPYDTIEELKMARTITENTWVDGLYDAYKAIEEEVDFADVETKRETGYGRDGYRRQVCSVCAYHGCRSFNFCPHCGNPMMPETPKGEDHESSNL